MGQFILGALISPAWLLFGLWLQNRWKERHEERAHQRDRERWLMAGRQVAYADLLKVAHRFNNELGEVAAEVRLHVPRGTITERFTKGSRTLMELQDELKSTASVAHIIGSDQVRLVAYNLVVEASGAKPAPGDDRVKERRAYSRRLRELELAVRADFGLSTTHALLLREPEDDPADQ